MAATKAKTSKNTKKVIVKSTSEKQKYYKIPVIERRKLPSKDGEEGLFYIIAAPTKVFNGPVNDPPPPHPKIVKKVDGVLVIGK